MIHFIKRLLCRHNGGVSFIRNLYGDEIMAFDGRRSLWRCKKCGASLASYALNKAPEH